jgi:hypothetical protein
LNNPPYDTRSGSGFTCWSPIDNAHAPTCSSNSYLCETTISGAGSCKRAENILHPSISCGTSVDCNYVTQCWNKQSAANLTCASPSSFCKVS